MTDEELTLEMRRPAPAGLGYVTVARMTITRDGHVDIDGDPTKLMTHIDGIDSDGCRHAFAVDPAAWARSIGTRFRSGRIVARVHVTPSRSE